MIENITEDLETEIVEAKKLGGSTVISLTKYVKHGQHFRIEKIKNTIVLTPVKIRIEDEEITWPIKRKMDKEYGINDIDNTNQNNGVLTTIKAEDVRKKEEGN